MILSTNKTVSGLDLIVSKLKQHPLCYQRKEKYYTSYYTHPDERPEKKLNSLYKKIINDACQDLTLFERGNFQNYYGCNCIHKMVEQYLSSSSPPKWNFFLGTFHKTFI